MILSAVTCLTEQSLNLMIWLWCCVIISEIVELIWDSFESSLNEKKGLFHTNNILNVNDKENAYRHKRMTSIAVNVN